MQGRSLLPVLRGRTPADWRTSMYYRYYHDPGDHNTRAHYGVRTRTHKLIYFWKKDQWELFDLVNDPYELHNLYGEPGQDALTASMKAELARLKREVRDDDQLADEQMPNGVDGPVARLARQVTSASPPLGEQVDGKRREPMLAFVVAGGDVLQRVDGMRVAGRGKICARRVAFGQRRRRCAACTTRG